MRWWIIGLAALACSSGDKSAAPDEQPPADVEPVALGIEEVRGAGIIVDDDAVVFLAASVASGDVTGELIAGGLRIDRLPAGGALDQAGLRAGDVISRIDGKPLAALAELRERYRASRHRGRVDIELIRDGTQLQRTYYWRADLPERTPVADDPIAEQLHEAIATGVRAVDDTRFEIDQLVVAALAERPAIASSGVSGRGGRDGAAVAPGVHPLTALGLTRYDSIRGVDDAPVSSATGLGLALHELADRPRFSLSIVRLGEPMILRYTVVQDLVMDAQLKAAVAAFDAREPIAPEPTRRRPPQLSPPVDGIREVGGRYYISRDVIERAIADAPRVLRARVVPHMQDGEIVGIKLYGIRRSSLLGAAGLKNGDSIRAVNGQPITHTDDLADLPGALRTADSVELSVVRRGKPITLRYRVEP